MSERQRQQRQRPRAMLFDGVVPVVSPQAAESNDPLVKHMMAGEGLSTRTQRSLVTEPWQQPVPSTYETVPAVHRQGETAAAPWPPVADSTSQAFLGIMGLGQKTGDEPSPTHEKMGLRAPLMPPTSSDPQPSAPQAAVDKEKKEQSQLTDYAFVEEDTNDMGRPRTHRLGYLEGLRGLMAIQALLWTFLRLFCPAVVVEVDGAVWMVVLRKALSPLFFDSTLPMSMYIVLMGRVGSQTFLERRKAVALAGPCIRRPIRLILPVAVSLAMTTVLNLTGAFGSANWLADRMPQNGDYVRPTPPITNFLVYFNSLVVLLFSPQTYITSRIIDFMPPKGLMWVISVGFQQTYVLTVLAWTLPYITRRSKMAGLGGMIVLSAWVARWSWYTLTGLALSEFSVVYAATLEQKTRKRLQYAALASMFVGYMLKYLYTAAFPSQRNSENVFHADLNTGKLLFHHATSGLVYPRYDDFLICVGLLSLVELSPALRNNLDVRSLRFFGSLGFAILLTAGPLLLSLGTFTYRALVEAHGFSDTAAVGVLFVTMIPACLTVAAIWARIVDDGALAFSRAFFRFLTT